MEAIDLMLKDWVFSKSIGKPCQVIGIDPMEGLGAQEGYTFKLAGPNRMTLFTHAVSVEPITITPEILLKNGFKFVDGTQHNTSSRYVWMKDGKRDGFIIEVTPYSPPVNGVKFLVRIDTESSYEGGVNSIHICDIEYIHQLQHAIKLCKIKKEIEL